MRVVICTRMAMAINTKHSAVYSCVLLTLSVQFKSLISVYMRASNTCAMEAVPALPWINRRVLPRHSPTMHTITTHYLDARTHCNAISATALAVFVFQMCDLNMHAKCKNHNATFRACAFAAHAVPIHWLTRRLQLCDMLHVVGDGDKHKTECRVMPCISVCCLLTLPKHMSWRPSQLSTNAYYESDRHTVSRAFMKLYTV